MFKTEFSQHFFSSQSLSSLSLTLSLSERDCFHISELINYFLLTWQVLRGKARRSSCLCGNLEPALRSFKWRYFHAVIQVKFLIPGILVVIAPVFTTQKQELLKTSTCMIGYACVYLCAFVFACLVLEVCDSRLIFFFFPSHSTLYSQRAKLTLQLRGKEWSRKRKENPWKQ